MKFKYFYEQETVGSKDFYHSTDSKNIDSIIQHGFRPSRGKNKYGVGIYGTANLEDQKSDLQSGNYGDAIIKATVPDGNFMNFTTDREPLAKQMDKFADPEKYPELFEFLSSPVRRDKELDTKAKMFVMYLTKMYPELVKELDGLVVDFAGTRIIVSYNHNEIKPEAVTTDGGDTWKRI